MTYLRYASCPDNPNHTETGRALWTLPCYQSVQKLYATPSNNIFLT